MVVNQTKQLSFGNHWLLLYASLVRIISNTAIYVYFSNKCRTKYRLKHRNKRVETIILTAPSVDVSHLWTTLGRCVRLILINTFIYYYHAVILLSMPYLSFDTY